MFVRTEEGVGHDDGLCASSQGSVTNILEENVLQPLLVSTNAIVLASETVRSILKIDDIVSVTVVLLATILHYEQLTTFPVYCALGVFFQCAD